MRFAQKRVMPRDHRKLHVFQLADKLILDLYRDTSSFPIAERFGLQSQLRRAAVSIAVNLVEGCARRTHGDYCRFVDAAFASSRECDYLISIAARLALLEPSTAKTLARQSNQLCASLMLLRKSLEKDDSAP